MKKNLLITLFLAMILSVQIISAQTSQFTYQGSLKDSGNAANGNYDFQFALFTAQTGGTQAGTTISANSVAVANGTFSVNLNFGAQFSGQDLFLEVRVRPTGGGTYTTLTPRQQINSAPYSVMSQSSNNALNLGGMSASQYVLTNDPRLSDSRNPLPGSSNYIQNTSTQQSANFNINGTGRAFILNSVSEYQLNGSRVLDANTSNLTVGLGAGLSGTGNTFIGANSGPVNQGDFNSFLGAESGNTNTLGTQNSFFGAFSGGDNISGSSNSFFGMQAGLNNLNGGRNTFVGSQSGTGNIDGFDNSFFGKSSGTSVVNGSNNTLIGAFSNVNNGSLVNSTAIGYRALVTQNNSLVLGSINGINQSTSDTRVGIGITAPTNPFTVIGVGSDFGGVPSSVEVVGRFQQRLSGNHTALSIDALFGQDSILYLAENGVAKWDVRNDSDMDSFQIRYQVGGANSTRFSINTSGQVAISVLGAAGNTSLCRNASNQISTCSSSIRYKNNINNFTSGLSLIKRLRPVSFNWNGSNELDMGLVAEEVAEVEPLLVTRNENGEVEGVKYDRVGVVLVNAVQEQQKQIDEQKEIIKNQQEQLENQRKEIEALKMLVCSQNPTAAICQPVKKEN